MSEFLGSVMMIAFFFFAGVVGCYVDHRKAEKKRKEEEMLNMAGSLCAVDAGAGSL